jgi:hypothetical protein
MPSGPVDASAARSGTAFEGSRFTLVVATAPIAGKSRGAHSPFTASGRAKRSISAVSSRPTTVGAFVPVAVPASSASTTRRLRSESGRWTTRHSDYSRRQRSGSNAASHGLRPSVARPSTRRTATEPIHSPKRSRGIAFPSVPERRSVFTSRLRLMRLPVEVAAPKLRVPADEVLEALRPRSVADGIGNRPSPAPRQALVEFLGDAVVVTPLPSSPY